MIIGKDAAVSVSLDNGETWTEIGTGSLALFVDALDDAPTVDLAELCRGWGGSGTWTVTHPRRLPLRSLGPWPVPHSVRMYHRQNKRARRLFERERQRGIL